MIKVTTYERREIALNPDLVEKIESVPETVITLTNGKKILVYDSMDDVINKFIDYKQQISFHLEKSHGEVKSEK